MKNNERSHINIVCVRNAPINIANRLWIFAPQCGRRTRARFFSLIHVGGTVRNIIDVLLYFSVVGVFRTYWILFVYIASSRLCRT